MTHYNVSITLRLAKNINQLPRFVKTFWISIYSATTDKNFMQIAHHLSELWKKQKGSFLWNTV